MKKSIKIIAGVYVLFFVAVSNSFSLDTDINDVITKEFIMPKGQYYEANVPDTIDIAERAALAVNGITSFLNEKKNYGLYGHGFLNVEKPYFGNAFGGGGAGNWGKIMEALLMMRLISGSDINLDIEEKSIEGMIDYCKADGSTPTARIMMSLISLHQLSPDPKLKSLIEKLKDSFPENAKKDGDMAYYYDGKFEDAETKLGVIGYGWNAFIQGNAMRALSRWHSFSGDQKILDFIKTNENYMLMPKFWQPEAGPKAVVGSEHGQFTGHHHSFCTGLFGLLWYADVTNNARLKQFVREGYEYLRTFGIARIGLFGEMCTTGDMTLLAYKLTNAGVGDYWEDIDCYVRNQLTERQVTDAAKLEAAVKAAPILGRLYPGMPDTIQKTPDQMQKPPEPDPINETEDNIVQRCVGIYLSDSAHPAHIPKTRLLWVICCTGNCPPALYAAWEGTVRCIDGNAQINLLLNRASPWLDIDSFLPYEGKVVIKNKSAKNLSVRIPLWADKKAVQCTINDKPVSFFWLGNYMNLTNLNAVDIVTIIFPMVSSTETYTLKWKDDDFWKECTDPGPSWKPQEIPDKFTFYFKGNTLINISPRPKDEVYPLYLRDNLKSDKAPFKKVKRFVPSSLIKM